MHLSTIVHRLEEKVKTEREYYNHQVEEAKQELETNLPPNSSHYSFDFAQQVFYLYDAQQTGRVL